MEVSKNMMIKGVWTMSKKNGERNIHLISFGAIIGAVIGVVLGHIATAIAIGVAMGAVFHVINRKKQK
ncbi:hypothetical protein [Bacillus smithii]|uniref:hypothetical protein n=1 Tax=Bacillus smithii TaxID=1479 RepID=UPI003D20524C